MKLHRTLRTWILVLLIAAVFPAQFLPGQPAQAQAVIKSLAISSIHTDAFPDIKVTARILDEAKKPVADVTAGSFTLSENGETVPFELEKVRVGTQAVVVLDVNAGITTAGLTGARQFDEMVQAATLFIEAMGEGDEAALLLSRQEGISLVHDFSIDKNSLKSALGALKQDYSVSGFTSTLDAVDLGVQKLKDIPGNAKDRVLMLVTPGIFAARGGSISNAMTGLVERANQSNISVYTVKVRRDDNPASLDQLAQLTSGLYTHFSGPASLDGILAEIDSKGFQHQFSYHSSSGAGGDRTLSISLSGSADPLDTETFQVSPAPSAPEVVSILVNNGDPVRRIAPQWDSDLIGIPQTEVQVAAKVEWPDGYARKLAKAELWVDNQLYGTPIQKPSSEFFFPWDIRKYQTPGSTTAMLEVRVVDELGFTASLDLQVPVEVSIPSRPTTPDLAVCNALEGLPWLASACRSLGITPSGIINFVLLIVVLVLVVILWTRRGEVSSKVKDIGAAASEAYNRLTQRTTRKKAKARLEAVEGIEKGQRTSFDLFGETPIGRDREHNELVFMNHPAVSREHCVIHENKVTGVWSIEDRESANGTYVNGTMIEAFDKNVILRNEDIVELGQTERGGIKFRFVILDSAPASDYDRPRAERNVRDSRTRPLDDDYEEENVRTTQPVQRPRPAPATPPEEERPRDNGRSTGGGYDPSQQTF